MTRSTIERDLDLRCGVRPAGDSCRKGRPDPEGTAAREAYRRICQAHADAQDDSDAQNRAVRG
jgi:hypothetical protein